MSARATAPGGRLLRAGVDRLMRRSLRKTFRRVAWLGPVPDLPADAPVVLYANHHTFHDGYLLHVALAEVFDRPGTIWMHDWDRYPFFAAAGAQPFPPDDPARRAATIRRTARRMRANPRTALALFPAGRLHPVEDGVGAFDAALLTRLGRLVPARAWCPVGLHVTWTDDERPIALLAAGPAQAAPDGEERRRLAEVVARLRDGVRSEAPARTLLDGGAGASARWNFAALRPFFERLL